MWRIPVSLFGGGGEATLVFDTVDAYVGDLFALLGSPSEPLDVVIIADAVDVVGIYVSSSFAPGSTFQCTAINSGRFIGTGGYGGNGGDDLGATGEAGNAGGKGGDAIASEEFTINVDIDDGSLLGGGGGGGGSASDDLGAVADAGGGGGGGIGWHLTTEIPNSGESASDGGLGGSGSSPAASNGGDGSPTTFGLGGGGGGTSTLFAIGGSGGSWGECGLNGYSDTGGFGSRRGGVGGLAGNAFAPISGAAALNLNGVLTEAGLRSGGKLLGETVGFVNRASQSFNFQTGVASVVCGWEHDQTGSLDKNTGGGTFAVAGSWWRSTKVGTSKANLVAANYEVAAIGGTRWGTWDASAAADDTYVAITAPRSWNFTTAGIRQAGQIFAVRRTIASGGSGQPLAMGYLIAEHEDFS